jgi:hypothetical protein
MLTGGNDPVIYAAQIEGGDALIRKLGLNDPDEKLERCPSG